MRMRTVNLLTTLRKAPTYVAHATNEVRCYLSSYTFLPNRPILHGRLNITSTHNMHTVDTLLTDVCPHSYPPTDIPWLSAQACVQFLKITPLSFGILKAPAGATHSGFEADSNTKRSPTLEPDEVCLFLKMFHLNQLGDPRPSLMQDVLGIWSVILLNFSLNIERNRSPYCGSRSQDLLE